MNVRARQDQRSGASQTDLLEFALSTTKAVKAQTFKSKSGLSTTTYLRVSPNSARGALVKPSTK